MTTENKLNVGCHTDIREGWINLDFHSENNADFIFNLEDIYRGLRIPIRNNSLDYVYCSHVLEHFNEPIPLLNEFIRMTKKGGLIEIRVPYFNEHFNSIEHIRPFTISTLEDFASIDNPLYRNSLEVVDKGFYPGESKGLRFLVKSILSSFFNLLGSRLIEKSFIKYLVPSGIYIKVIYRK